VVSCKPKIILSLATAFSKRRPDRTAAVENQYKKLVTKICVHVKFVRAIVNINQVKIFEKLTTFEDF
jgi:hypothetical protein